MRTEDDFAADPRLIPGSIGRSYQNAADWGKAFCGRTVIVVCQRGTKLSEGTAAWLRHAGAEPGPANIRTVRSDASTAPSQPCRGGYEPIGHGFDEGRLDGFIRSTQNGDAHQDLGARPMLFLPIAAPPASIPGYI